jgi:methylthioribose-1-phosphate isomerase
MDADRLRSAVDWRDGRLEVVDQTLLPGRLRVVAPATVAEVVDALRRLVVRGAPAIGVAGAFGVVLGVDHALRGGAGDLDRARTAMRRAAVELEAARPTAVNLRWAVRRVVAAASAAASAAELRRLALAEAERILQEDREACRLADTAAGAALAGGRVDGVLVGCDRVARNGDTANKIGTYALAVLARANGVPFYVVGPLSSFDPDAADGAAIVIEQRPAAEVSTLGGTRVAPEAAGVWNPAFDVTPAALVTAFITDAGVLRPPFEASIAAALAGQGRGQAVSPGPGGPAASGRRPGRRAAAPPPPAG